MTMICSLRGFDARPEAVFFRASGSGDASLSHRRYGMVSEREDQRRKLQPTTMMSRERG